MLLYTHYSSSTNQNHIKKKIIYKMIKNSYNYESKSTVMSCLKKKKKKNYIEFCDIFLSKKIDDVFLDFLLE